MNKHVVCPRCEQDYLQRVELVRLGRLAILCPECDALWLDEERVGPPTREGYGVVWFDYGTFMRNAGREPDEASEVVVLGPFTGAND